MVSMVYLRVTVPFFLLSRDGDDDDDSFLKDEKARLIPVPARIRLVMEEPELLCLGLSEIVLCRGEGGHSEESMYVSLRDLPSKRLLLERDTRLAFAPFLLCPVISVRSGVEHEWERELTRNRGEIASAGSMADRMSMLWVRAGGDRESVSLSSVEKNLRRGRWSLTMEGIELILTLFSVVGVGEVWSGILLVLLEDLRIGVCLPALLPALLVMGENFFTGA